ncbi:RHS repeat-associated core domain-containing protein [Allokutzneria oryzae]|uniref:RHS repeat-associated core domain-containing protein n=1 Tax=Allokutzneria oryzae TaxID=1378989 RepID=A0ABV5ZXG0_9PSEU
MPVTKETLTARAPDETTTRALRGNQTGTAGKAGAGSYSATSLSSSATWQVSAQNGDFSWSYPLRVPPAPGGLTPDLGLSYSSSAVDGLTSATNTQSSWVGDGWSMWPGFIERSYRSCADDLPGTARDKPQDLCWISDNATMSRSGASSKLIRDDGTGVWRPQQDDGSRIEHLFGASNGDNDGEHWKITTVDGTQYFFGSRTDAKSTWTVPVFGNDPKEPCHSGEFATSSCVQGYRWNLDKIVDRHGNVISYFYETETNHYGRNKNSAATEYVRDGWLARIDYGLREDQALTAAGRVVFTVADRCVPGADCTPDKTANWPDVPWDMKCDGGTCKDKWSPSFWTTKRLSKITTQVAQGTGYSDVDSWTLRHEFPDPGDGEKPALWLKGITHTGHAGQPVSLPEVTFEGVRKANRVYAVDGHAALIRYRMNAIVSETGGVTSIKYAEPQCVSGSAMPANPETNTMLCFPVRWAAPLSAERTDYFHKYVVESVTNHDRIGSSVGDITRYEYLGGAAWRFDESEITKEDKKTWNDYRGFSRVIVRRGSGQDGPTTKTEQLFYRGMHGDKQPTGTRAAKVVDSERAEVTDEPWLAGTLRESITYDGERGAVVSKAITEPTWQGPTAVRGPFKAYIVGTGVERDYTALEAGGWRVTRTETAYDDRGLPTQVNDLGDIASPADDRCVRTTYARNQERWLLAYPSRVEAVSVHCGTKPVFPDHALSDIRNSYDGQDPDLAPTTGNLTKAEVLKERPASGPVYVTTAKHSYDVHGRVTESRNALDHLTKTDYTPRVGGPVTQIVSTNAAGHTTTTVLEPAHEQATRVTDPNGRVTESAYDALGRLIEVWLPNRNRANSQRANYEFSYLVRADAPVAISTTAVGPNGNYTTSVALHDGLLRPRQTQAPAPGGGRLLTDTRYDSQGRSYKTTLPYFNDAAVDTNLWAAGDADVPGTTLVEFDGVGRPASQTFKGGTVQWRMTTRYGGDRVHVTPRAGDIPTTTITDARGQTTELRQYKAATPTGDYDTTTYTHTPAGQLATVTGPGGNVWRNTYDLRGLRTKAEDPDKGTSTMTYDDAGQLVTTRDARDVVLAYGYDALGRKTGVHSGSLTGPKLVEWTYDTAPSGKGLAASSTRWVNGSAYTRKALAYNSLNQPVGTEIVIPPSEGPLAGTYASYARYNPDGTPTSLTYPAAGDLAVETVSHTYDDLGLPLTTFGGGIDYVTSTLYTRYREVQRVQLGEGGKRVWLSSYYDDNTRRLNRTIIDAELPKPMQADVNYTHDPAGNITTLADTPRELPADTQCFRYDYLRRLTEAWTPTNGCQPDPSTSTLGGPGAYWHSFTYDKAGNRRTETQHDGTGNTQRDYTYPQGTNSLASVSTTGPASKRQDQFGYDKAGNTTSRDLAGAKQVLDWDLEGRLTKVTDGPKGTEFVHDADGSRLIRRDPGGATVYLGGQEVRWDRATDKKTTTRYYTHGGSAVAIRTSAGHTWLAGDHQGTAQIAINAQSLEVTRRRQTPFGTPRGAAVSFPGEKGFVGGTIDASIGLITLGARQYDAANGRFLSVDPIMDLADPQQLHAYAYSNNSPITFSDPDGRRYLGPDGVLGGYDPALHSSPEQHKRAQESHRNQYEGSKGGGGKLPGIPKKPLAKQPKVQNEKLRNILDKIYPSPGLPDWAGDGKTADAVRNEFRTGNPTFDKYHVTAAWDRLQGLLSLLEADRVADINGADKLSASDRDFTVREAKELWRAVNEKDRVGAATRSIKPEAADQIKKVAERINNSPSFSEVSDAEFQRKTYRGREVGPPRRIKGPTVDGFARGLGIFEVAAIGFAVIRSGPQATLNGIYCSAVGFEVCVRQPDA